MSRLMNVASSETPSWGDANSGETSGGLVSHVKWHLPLIFRRRRYFRSRRGAAGNLPSPLSRRVGQSSLTSPEAIRRSRQSVIQPRLIRDVTRRRRRPPQPGKVALPLVGGKPPNRRPRLELDVYAVPNALRWGRPPGPTHSISTSSQSIAPPTDRLCGQRVAFPETGHQS
jgi:hypothetical protein